MACRHYRDAACRGDRLDRYQAADKTAVAELARTISAPASHAAIDDGARLHRALRDRRRNTPESANTGWQERAYGTVIAELPNGIIAPALHARLHYRAGMLPAPRDDPGRDLARWPVACCGDPRAIDRRDATGDQAIPTKVTLTGIQRGGRRRNRSRQSVVVDANLLQSRQPAERGDRTGQLVIVGIEVLQSRQPAERGYWPCQ